MSGIADPGQEYFKNGLWGWVTDQWKKLIGDAAGHLQVDVVDSGLPAGASTAAIQATMLTALQSIQNLVGALHDVGADELDVVIDGQSADVEIKQTAAADLTPGIMGWDGSAWRKLPMVWGYSDTYRESETLVDVAAGNRSLTFSTVPAGEVWVIQSVVAVDITSTITRVEFRAYEGAVSTTFVRKVAPVANIAVEWSGGIALKADDFLRVNFFGCILNDDLYAFAIGYKMKVAE